jgi:hypothetical protein
MTCHHPLVAPVSEITFDVWMSAGLCGGELEADADWRFIGYLK